MLKNTTDKSKCRVGRIKTPSFGPWFCDNCDKHIIIKVRVWVDNLYRDTFLGVPLI